MDGSDWQIAKQCHAQHDPHTNTHTRRHTHNIYCFLRRFDFVPATYKTEKERQRHPSSLYLYYGLWSRKGNWSGGKRETLRTLNKTKLFFSKILLSPRCFNFSVSILVGVGVVFCIFCFLNIDANPFHFVDCKLGFRMSEIQSALAESVVSEKVIRESKREGFMMKRGDSIKTWKKRFASVRICMALCVGSM